MLAKNSMAVDVDEEAVHGGIKGGRRRETSRR
jgi:hypothetical protein